MWQWDPSTRRYRVTPAGSQATGQRAGTFVGEAKMLQLRDQYIDARKDAVNTLATQLANREITIQQWTDAMRQEIKTNMINEYLLAHGGRNSMTQADWGRVGQMVQTQYRFLDNFAAEAGDMSEKAIAARSRMYVEASSQAFERGKVLARGMPDLPAYPGDGSTACRANCACGWEIHETAEAWLCYWTLGAAEHCPDCLSRASQWAPLVISK